MEMKRIDEKQGLRRCPIDLVCGMVAVLSFWGVLLGCAKERPYDVLYKDQNLVSRATIDTEREYLYTSSTMGVPRFTESMRPYMQGKERIVKWRWEEGGLTAYQVEDEARYRDNPLNEKPILTIPGEYLAFRCALNEDDECNNREEVNTETHWQERDHFLPEFKDIAVREFDSLMLPTTDDSCFSEVDGRLVRREIGRHFINIEIEKSYRFADTHECILQLWYGSGGYEEFMEKLDENGGTFNTRISFNFADLEKISDPDYQAIEYPIEDQRIYGFFSSKHKHKDIIGRTDRDYYMQRWSPLKKGTVDAKGNRLVTYTLGKEFAKPDNAYLKRATEEAFERMNFTLEKNRVKLRLNLVQGDENTRSGDLRNTMLNLIEDIASPLLGYGPSVANPRTGEIIRAHANMYKGSLEYNAPYSYYLLRAREIRDASGDTSVPPPVVESWQKGLAVPKANFREQLMNSESVALSPRNIGPPPAEQKDFVMPLLERPTFVESNQDTEAWENFLSGASENPIDQWKNFRTRDLDEVSFEVFSAKLQKSMAQGNVSQFEVERSQRILQALKTRKQGLRVLQRNNGYTVDKLNLKQLGQATLDQINAVSGVRDQAGRLRPWMSLNRGQQRQLLEILVTNSYVPVLIHEIGHNLGLRHNFYGSADKNHYWGEEAQQVLGLNAKTSSSSIMDYSTWGVSELSTFGPYDIAALRYAYNREMPTLVYCRPENGQQVSHPQGTPMPVCEELASQNSGDLFYEHVQKSAPKQLQNRAVVLKMYQLPDGVLASHVPSGANFRYCTDEDRGQSLFCNVFDEGSTIRELLDFRIREYRDSYAVRNVRWLRDNMSERDHIWHLISIYRELAGVRTFHEMWQWAANQLQGTVPEGTLSWGCSAAFANKDSGTASMCRQLEDIIYANNTAGRFLLDLVKMPDKVCHASLVDHQQGPRSREVFLSLGKDIANIARWSYMAFPHSEGRMIDVYGLTDCHNPLVAQYYQHLYGQRLRSRGVRINILGERGQIHNDVAAFPRRGIRSYVGDLEVRGAWMEKLLAMEILTYQGLMTTRGGNVYRSYFEHPAFNEELGNLIEHYSYTLPLRGEIPFRASNGFEYYTTTLTGNVNYSTPSPDYHRFLRLFLPFPNQDFWSIGPVMLRMAANASEVPERELPNNLGILSRVHALRDFMTVGRYHSTFMTPNALAEGESEAKSYSIPGINQTYVASERNGLAAKLIDLLEGGLDANSGTIDQALAELTAPPPVKEEGAVAETEEVTEIEESKEEVEATPTEPATEPPSHQWPSSLGTAAAQAQTGIEPITVAPSEGARENPHREAKSNSAIDQQVQAILNNVMDVKAVSDLLANDVFELERRAHLSAGNMQIFQSLMGGLTQRWGQHRVTEALQAYRVKHAQTRGVVQKFLDIGYLDLLYYTGDAESKEGIRNNLLDALISIPQQNVGVSF